MTGDHAATGPGATAGRPVLLRLAVAALAVDQGSMPSGHFARYASHREQAARA
jgi:hypothetical protein